MNTNRLSVDRRYEPDEDAMLNALALIFRAKSPPINEKETVGHSLQAQPTVSTHTTRPGTGDTRV